MTVISRFAQLLSDCKALRGGREVPGLRFAGEGIHGESNQAASSEDVLNRDLQGRQLRRPPAIVDSRAAAPLGAETPAPCNLRTVGDVPSTTVVAEVKTDAAVETRDEPKPSLPTLPKQSVEEASAAVMNALLSREKVGLRRRQQRQPRKRQQRQQRNRQQ